MGCFCLISLGGETAHAQTWSPPIAISQNTEQMAGRPRIIADPFGRTHIFWEENVAGLEGSQSGDTIYYAYTDGKGVSEPIDIMAINGGEIQLGGVSIGPQEQLSIVWTDHVTLYYSWAWPEYAADARQWATEVIARSNGGLNLPDLYTDRFGKQHIVWVDRDGLVVRYLSRAADAALWSSELTIWDAPPNRRAIGPRVVVDGAGVLHVVWFENAADNNWRQSGVRYNRSADNGATWSNTLFDPEQGAWASLGLDAEDNIHLVWQHGVGSLQGRWHSYSADRGLTWTPPKVMFEPGPVNGLTRWALLALDGGGNLRYVTPFNVAEINGQRISGGLLHSVWSGNTWSGTEAIPGATGEFADFTISDGNHLHVVYHGRLPDSGVLAVWYADRYVDAPQILRRSRVVPTPIVTPVSSPTKTPQPTVAPLKATITQTTTLSESRYHADTGSSLEPVLLAALSAGLLIAMVAARELSRRAKNHPNV